MPDWPKEFIFVTSCDVLIGYFSEHEDDVADEMALIRSLAEDGE